jgi:hypothetical protein
MPRRVGPISAALIAVALVTVGVVPASGSTVLTPGYTKNCPTAARLVFATRWHTHHLAPGVVLREGHRRDSTGFVRMHVLSVDVTNPALAFRPLVRKLTTRQQLSSFSGRRRLVAATNAGYFDWRTGAPLGAAVARGRPIVTTRARTNVVGFARNGLMQAGHLSAGGEIVASSSTRPLAGVNRARPGTGITAYTSRWGRASVVLPHVTVGRYVRNGSVVSAARRFGRAPRSGYLLVARGHSASHWLRHLQRPAQVRIRLGAHSDAPRPFRLAYAVGGQIVRDGRALPRLSCPRRYPKPARTAVGFADDGRRLILVAVDDNMRTALHGLDSVQLGKVMADLGAREAYLFDGGGSTTMLARMHRGARRLSLRTRTAERVERRVPLGFGIYRR